MGVPHVSAADPNRWGVNDNTDFPSLPSNNHSGDERDDGFGRVLPLFFFSFFAFPLQRDEVV